MKTVFKNSGLHLRCLRPGGRRMHAPAGRPMRKGIRRSPLERMPLLLPSPGLEVLKTLLKHLDFPLSSNKLLLVA